MLTPIKASVVTPKPAKIHQDATVPMMEMMPISVSSEMENRIDDNNSTAARRGRNAAQVPLI